MMMKECTTTLKELTTKELPIGNSRLFLMLPFAILLSLWNLSEVAFMKHRQLHDASSEFETSSSIQQQTSLPPPSPSLSSNNNQQLPIIDIISVGSLLRPHYQDTQRRTFATHAVVRNLFQITERNDTDATCFTDLTSDQLHQIVDYCAQTEHQSYISKTLRQRLFEPKKHIGWMCAQKRPLDGLYQVLQRYVRNESNIPDFLFIIDDDTFINMDRLVPDLIQNYPVDIPYAVAGCNFDFLKKESGITFPYGGFGTFLTKAAIARLIQPFYCDGRDEHSNLACWRLNINALGEKQFYTEGMSVLDLMQAYGANIQFTQVESWTNKTGYCLHSDHALAYFINFYHITVPEGTLDRHQRPTDRIRRKYSFVGLAAGDDKSECEHVREVCNVYHRICHYTTPSQMEALYSEQQQQAQAQAQQSLVAAPQ